MQTLEQLKRRVDQLDLQIKWANFALRAPDQFINEGIQAMRHRTLASLLQEKTATLEKLIALRDEHAETHRALDQLGASYHCHDGEFFIKP